MPARARCPPDAPGGGEACGTVRGIFPKGQLLAEVAERPMRVGRRWPGRDHAAERVDLKNHPRLVQHLGKDGGQRGFEIGDALVKSRAAVLNLEAG